MDKSMMKGVLIGVAAVAAVGVIAGYQAINKKEGPGGSSGESQGLFDRRPVVAQVLKVDPVHTQVKTSREVCKDVPVSRQAPVKDENRVAGTAVGAVVGGLIGNQIGGGTGKTLATVGGAAAGAYAGNQVQKNMQENRAVTTYETRCTTVYDTQKKVVGYDVAYVLDGQRGVVRMDHKPGDTIPVENGKLVLVSQPGGK